MNTNKLVERWKYSGKNVIPVAEWVRPPVIVTVIVIAQSARPNHGSVC
jgi:hypothetical protein